MALTTGNHLGRYEILAQLGAGGGGEVYHARDNRLRREVAIKVLHAGLAQNPHHLARFEREARLLAALSHPNLAILYGLEEADGIQFLVLEYVPGQTLAERFRAQRPSLQEVLTFGRQIAAALQAAHGREIIHRDLKPANIKITPDGQVKVLDFGIAKPTATEMAGDETALCHQTRQGAILGTPPYMSPEQVRGQPVDRRTDIWSFGCVLYEALAGRRAFPGNTMYDIFSAVVERPPDWSALPAGLSRRMVDLLQCCLAKDPSLRLADMDNVRNTLEQEIHSLGKVPALANEASLSTRTFQPAAEPQPEVKANPAPMPGVIPPSQSANGTANTRALRPRKLSRPVAVRSPRRPWRWLLGLTLCGVLGYVGYDQFYPYLSRYLGLAKPDKTTIETIGVFPLFLRGDPDPQLEPVGRQVTNRVMRNLTQIAELRVLQVPTDVLRTQTEPEEAGRQLGAQAVLLLKLEKQGETVTVGARLIEIPSGEPLWQKKYPYRLTPEATAGQREQELAQLAEEAVADLSGKLLTWLANHNGKGQAAAIQVPPMKPDKPESRF